MIKKVTINKITKYDRPYSKEGEEQKPLYAYKKGSNVGKNFSMVTIQTDETGDDYYSTPAMSGDKVYNIEVGQKLLLNLTEKKSDDGTKVFKNFNFPTKDQLAAYAAEMAG